jgi:hypothetical protein
MKWDVSLWLAISTVSLFLSRLSMRIVCSLKPPLCSEMHLTYNKFDNLILLPLQMQSQVRILNPQPNHQMVNFIILTEPPLEQIMYKQSTT